MEVNKHVNDVDYSEPQMTFNEQMDKLEAERAKSNFSSPDSSLSSIGEVAFRKVDNSGKQIGGVKVPKKGRKSYANANNLQIIQEVRKENELSNLRVIANNLIEENAKFILPSKIDGMYKKANTGQTETVKSLISDIKTIRAKHDSQVEASNKARDAIYKRSGNFLKSRNIK